MKTISPKIAWIALAGLVALIIICLVLGTTFSKEPETAASMFANSHEEMYGYYEDRDTDGDTLNDLEEHETHGTNIFSADTDGDGLFDNEELAIKTDPLKADTDKDGILDGTEVRAGTDPLTKDNHQKMDRTVAVYDNMKVEMSGNAAIYDTVVTEFDVVGISRTPGVLTDVCWIYSEKNQNNKLTVEIGKIDQEVSIYSLENNTEFKKIETDIQESEDMLILSAEVKNGKYFVGACSFLDDFKNNTDAIDVFLLIDDSGSMYDEEMDGKGNDPQYKRVMMCSNLLLNASKNIKFGLATFTADYMEKSGITENRDSLFEALTEMTDTPHEDKKSQFNGTFIATSIYKALDNFDANSPRRQVLVLLTDGETTEDSWMAMFKDPNTVDESIQKAEEKNVSIITVALGNDVNADYLTNIESSTDGAYIYANNADAMEDLYAAILNAVNYNFADTDNDGSNDCLVRCDSGFRANKDGFNFHNPIVTTGKETSFGVCYGISMFSSLYYQNKLQADCDSLDFTEYEQSLLRVFAKTPLVQFFADTSDIVFQYVPGFDGDTAKLAGFETERDNIVCDSPLYTWSTETLTNYNNMFYWETNSEYYNEDKTYTAAAEEIFSKYATIWQVTYEGKTSSREYPCLAILNKETPKAMNEFIGELSDDEKKTNALLTMLWRYQFHQHSSVISDNRYTLADDYDTVINLLSSGTPLVLSTGDHAMVLCGIRQSLTHPSLYYLDLYDNNYPGEDRTMTATFKTNSANQVYIEYKYGGTTYTNITLDNVQY